VADAQEEFEHCDVWPENWDAAEVFCRCDSQWIVLLGLGGLYYQGLDYQRVTCVARDWLGVTPTRQLLDQIRVMEHEAKKILND
jgi:hypothetical protein